MAPPAEGRAQSATPVVIAPQASPAMTAGQWKALDRDGTSCKSQLSPSGGTWTIAYTCYSIFPVNLAPECKAFIKHWDMH